MNAEVILRVITSMSDADLSANIKTLDLESCDTLMKYLNRFMETTPGLPALLKAHALVVAKAGLSTIVKTYAERKTV